MRQLRCFGAILLAGIIILPALADDKDKDKDKPDTPTPEKPTTTPTTKTPAPPAEKWTTVWETIGTVNKVNAGSISLKVEDQAANQQQAMQRLQQLLRSRSRSRGRISMPANTGNAAPKTKDVDLILADDVKVRIGDPPIEFDDKGNLKKYSSEELKNLKGGEKTWGFAADTSQLKPGEIVRVTVARKKSSGPKTKDTVPDEPVVKMVFILKDPGDKAAAAADKTKKK